MGKIDKILIVIGALTLVLIFILIISNILIPAYVSYTISCKPQVYKEVFSETYSIVGQVSTDNETDELTIDIFEPDPQVLKHELIHVNQLYKNRLYSCEAPVFRYFNEVEAYTFQDLPNSIFYKLYDAY